MLQLRLPKRKSCLPGFYPRDAKPCTNSMSCLGSYRKEVIDKAKKTGRTGRQTRARAKRKAREKARTRTTAMERARFDSFSMTRVATTTALATCCKKLRHLQLATIRCGPTPPRKSSSHHIRVSFQTQSGFGIKGSRGESLYYVRSMVLTALLPSRLCQSAVCCHVCLLHSMDNIGSRVEQGAELEQGVVL